MATIYIRPEHPIPHCFFIYISINYRNYILMADIDIYSRSKKEKSYFQDLISMQTSGTLPSTNISQLCRIEVLDLIGSDHASVKKNTSITTSHLPTNQYTAKNSLTLWPSRLGQIKTKHSNTNKISQSTQNRSISYHWQKTIAIQQALANIYL